MLSCLVSPRCLIACLRPHRERERETCLGTGGTRVWCEAVSGVKRFTPTLHVYTHVLSPSIDKHSKTLCLICVSCVKKTGRRVRAQGEGGRVGLVLQGASALCYKGSQSVGLVLQRESALCYKCARAHASCGVSQVLVLSSNFLRNQTC